MKNAINKVFSSLAVKGMTITAFLLGALPTAMFAQGPGFGGSVNDGGGVCAPIDGGLSMLAAAGVGYGVKKYLSYKASAKNTTTK